MKKLFVASAAALILGTFAAQADTYVSVLGGPTWAPDLNVGGTKRAMDMKKNPLDEIEGVGPGRKRALLHAFGSARGVSRAAVADLMTVEGISQPLAERIHAFFRKA